MTDSTSGSHTSPLRTLPNQLTTLRLLLSFVMFGTIWAGMWKTSFALFAVAAITDWLDGYFARLYNLTSSFGRAYDPLVDKVMISGAFIFLMDVSQSGLEPWMVTVVVAREFLVTGIRGYLEEIGVPFGADWLGKIKMVLQCAAMLWILFVLDRSYVGDPPQWMFGIRDLLNMTMVLTTIASGGNYLRKAIRVM